MTETPAPSTNSTVKEIHLRTLTTDLAGRWTDPPPETVGGVRIDSRNCKSGDLFVALEGAKTHGHEFVDDAVDQGATALVVEEEQDIDCPQWVVDDSEGALQQLAVRFRESREDLYVIAVNGSCGKTTVKEMIYHVLSPIYDVDRTPGNYNNQLGVPLTLLNHGHGEVLVAELAMNKPGEIEMLTEWTQPELAVITHVGPAHLQGLKNVETAAYEHGQLLAGLPDDGIALVPGWIPHLGVLRDQSAVKLRLVDRDPEAEYPVNWQKTTSGVELRLGLKEYELSMEGEHFVKDAALAIVAALEMGVPDTAVARRIATFQPLEGRGRVIDIDGTPVLDDSYNANPDSFRAALDRLKKMPSPRLALVGDMKELGPEAERYHRELGEQLAECPETDVHYVGEFAVAVRQGYTGEHMTTYDNIEQLPELSPDEYGAALVKASNSIGLNDVLNRWRDRS